MFTKTGYVWQMKLYIPCLYIQVNSVLTVKNTCIDEHMFV